MKRTFRYLVLMACVVLGLCGTAGAVSAAPSNNVGGVYNGYWASPASSYLYVDGEELVRVELIDSEVVVERYDSGFNCLSQETFEMELPRWGGFYAGEDYNFLLFGQNNAAEDDTVEVIRVVRYTKDWQRVDCASIRGINTIRPFDAGGMSVTEYGGMLYLHTCHTMYMTSDGYNHQANLSIVIRESDMAVTDTYDEVSHPYYGYVSHSFNQFILADSEGRLVTLDHGDASPSRGVWFYRYESPAGSEQLSRGGTCGRLASFGGTDGSNYTGACVTGLEETSTGYLCLYSSVWQSNDTKGDPVLYLTYAAKDLSSIETRPVAENVQEGQIVATGTDSGYILWTDAGDDTMYYAPYSGDGTVGQAVESDAMRSDCQPIIYNGQVVWYAADFSVPVFYALDGNGLETGKPEGEEGEKTLAFLKENGCLYAQWDDPLEGKYDYCFIYACSAAGERTLVCSTWAGTNKAAVDLTSLPAGTYDTFLVTMTDTTGTVVGKYSASVSLTVTEETGTAPKAALTEEGYLDMEGLAPSTYVWCRLQAGEEKQEWTGVTSSLGHISFPVAEAYRTGTYSLWQFPTVTVDETGTTVCRQALALDAAIPEVGQDAGEDEKNTYAVSNLRFEMNDENVPVLRWDVSEEGDWYVVYLSQDGGTTWEMYKTADDSVTFWQLEPGVYNAVKVTTVDKSVEVAMVVAKDMTLTITQGETLPAAKVVIAKDETNKKYQVAVSGLTPNTGCLIGFQGGTSYTSRTSCAGPEGTLTATMALLSMNNLLKGNGTFLVQEFQNTAVSADGKTAAMTVCDRGEWTKVEDVFGTEGDEGVSVAIKVTGGADVTLGETTSQGEDVSFQGVKKGTYTLTAKRGGCLTHTIKDIAVEDQNVDLGTIDLVAGDVNGDDKINIADMGVFRQEFGKTGDAIGNTYTDVNDDGKVNIADMGIFRQNFGKTAEKDCTVEYVTQQ